MLGNEDAWYVVGGDGTPAGQVKGPHVCSTEGGGHWTHRSHAVMGWGDGPGAQPRGEKG